MKTLYRNSEKNILFFLLRLSQRSDLVEIPRRPMSWSGIRSSLCISLSTRTRSIPIRICSHRTTSAMQPTPIFQGSSLWNIAPCSRSQKTCFCSRNYWRSIPSQWLSEHRGLNTGFVISVYFRSRSWYQNLHLHFQLSGSTLLFSGSQNGNEW